MKKLLSFLITMNFILILSWAMPGFQSYLPDSSGEYVYYKDNTFLRESYIGILYYDDSTLQLRYFAPRDIEKQLPEKDISMLVSLNKDSDNLELLGERILGTVAPGSDNVIIVNYLRSLLYDFSSHRKLIINLNERNIELYQDYDQFGGQVSIIYDCTIPIFNIREIKKTTGEPLLTCCTTGQLVDNYDNSFENFKGFPPFENKNSKNKYKNANKLSYTFNNQLVTLDTMWKQPMENIWTLEDDSLLSMRTVPQSLEIKTNDDLQKNRLFILRKLTESTSNSYADFSTLKIKDNFDYDSWILNKDNDAVNLNSNIELEISVEIYQPITGKTIINYKKLLPKKDSYSYDFFTMATFKEPYLDNKQYYENIINSYKN